jgi:hypothetical protein
MIDKFLAHRFACDPCIDPKPKAQSPKAQGPKSQSPKAQDPKSQSPVDAESLGTKDAF